MANAPLQVGIFNPLPDEEFLSRNSDVERLFHAGLDVVRSLQSSCFLAGNRKSGKTEILKRVYNRMFWDQDVVVPFFHSVSSSLNSAEAFCREYFFRNVLQFVGFLRKDPMLVMGDEFNLSRILQLAYESKFPWLVETLDNFHAYAQIKDLQALTRLTINFPAMASTKSGLPALVIVDDFHRISRLPSAEERGYVTSGFLVALESRQAPHFLSGSLKPVLKDLLKPAELSGTLDILSLTPLRPAESQLLFEKLCQRFDVPYEPNISLAVAQQLDNNPFYLHTMVLTARHESGDFRSIRKFADLYSREITKGNLHLYFNGLLHSTSLNSVERIKTLELLRLCTREPLDLSIFQYSKNHKGGGDYDFEKIVSVLDELDLVDYGLGVVTSVQDQVLRDWIEWNFSHKISGAPIYQASYGVTSMVLSRFSQSMQFRAYTDRVEQIRQVLLALDCQTVPSVLFDGACLDAEQKSETLASSAVEPRETPEVTLPEIISVNVAEMGWRGGQDGPGQILVAYGFTGKRYLDSDQVAWLVGYCPSPLTVGLEEIQQFYRQCQLLAQQEGLKSVNRWFLSEDRFNESALSFAAQYGIQTSNRAQFERLCNLILKRSAACEEGVNLRDLVTYEMSVPLVSDAELVAVRALEQIAENINLIEKAKGQVRMALIEACINAKSMAPDRTETIHLKFLTGSDRLVINLRAKSRGNNKTPFGKEAATGWGLKLLQTLMDEVRISLTDSGTELTMTKYLNRAKKEAV